MIFKKSNQIINNIKKNIYNYFELVHADQWIINKYIVLIKKILQLIIEHLICFKPIPLGIHL